MNSNRALLGVVLAGLLFSVVPTLAATPPTLLNYQGVLRDSQDKPRTGSFDMTFRFYDADGGPSCSGGTLLLTDMHAAVGVNGGLFNVQLGGGSITPGTKKDLGEVFRDSEPAYVEVQVQGETLCPRIRVVSAAYALNAGSVKGADLVAPGPLDLYANALTGNDANDGLSPARPKKTIQAAVDAAPFVFRGDVRVHIADGKYTEQVILQSRYQAAGFGLLYLSGNDSNPGAVILEPPPGPDAPGEGILSFNVRPVVSGMTIRNFANEGLSAQSGGGIVASNCRLEGNRNGAYAAGGGYLELAGCRRAAREGGERPGARGGVNFGGGVEISNNSDLGVFVVLNGTARFNSSPCTIANNNLLAKSFSTIKGYGSCAVLNSACIVEEVVYPPDSVPPQVHPLGWCQPAP